MTHGTMPPRNPNDDEEDDDDENGNGDSKEDLEPPAVREPDEDE